MISRLCRYNFGLWSLDLGLWFLVLGLGLRCCGGHVTKTKAQKPKTKNKNLFDSLRDPFKRNLFKGGHSFELAEAIVDFRMCQTPHTRRAEFFHVE